MRLSRKLLPLVTLAIVAKFAVGCSSSSGAAGDAGAAGQDTSDAAASANDASAPVPTPDGGGPALHDAGASGDTGGGGDDGSADAGAIDAAPIARQSFVWVWQDYANSLNDVTDNASSFTQISPALYQLNYDYASGPAQALNGDDNYDGLSSAQIAQQIHDAGLKCIPFMYAGAGNSGTDQGIQNVLNDSPLGAQDSFITSMVSEGMTKGYDGFNLDWEVATTDDTYSAKYISFLTKFKQALNAQGMILSVDIAGWYILQCDGSCGTGMVDLTKLGPSVDQAIIEDYAGSFTSTATACPAAPSTKPGATACDSDFGNALEAMCNVPPNVVGIGMIVTDSNAFAPAALAGVTSYGFRSVAVWPGNGEFMDPTGIPNGQTWYSLLAGFLAQP